MRLYNKPWLALALIAACTFIALYAIDWYQHRVVRSEKDLIGLLPDNDATVFYARIDLLRRAGLLKLLAASHDPEYHSFVLATNFDYSKDLDAVAGSAKGGNVFLAAKGKFDWSSIESYVRQEGGECNKNTCKFRSGKSGRWLSLIRVQANVMGLSLGPNDLSGRIHPGQQPVTDAPADPVWVRVPPELLRNSATLPAPLRIFAISLQSANSVVIALGPAPAGSSASFEIKLNAGCPSAVIADTIRKQLEIDTKLLRLELAHEHEKANPADLTGLLTSGTFQTDGKEVHGTWPVSKELLEALQ